MVSNTIGTRDQFHGRQFSHRQVWGGVRWFQEDSSPLHVPCTLFLLLLHQLHFRSSGIRSGRVGSPAESFSIYQHSSPEKEHVQVYSCSRLKQMLEPLLHTRLHGYPSERNTLSLLLEGFIISVRRQAIGTYGGVGQCVHFLWLL